MRLTRTLLTPTESVRAPNTGAARKPRNCPPAPMAVAVAMFPPWSAMKLTAYVIPA